MFSCILSILKGDSLVNSFSSVDSITMNDGMLELTGEPMWAHIWTPCQYPN